METTTDREAALSTFSSEHCRLADLAAQIHSAIQEHRKALKANPEDAKCRETIEQMRAEFRHILEQSEAVFTKILELKPLRSPKLEKLKAIVEENWPGMKVNLCPAHLRF